MTQHNTQPKNMEEAGMKSDDALYKNEEITQKRNNGIQQRYEDRDAGLLLMEEQGSQQGNQKHQEQFSQIGQSRETLGYPRSGQDQNGQSCSSQQGRQEQNLHLSGYNIAKSSESDLQQEGQENNNLRKKGKDSNSEMGINEFYQGYGQDDPLEKRI
ncbi:hypothetical protein V7128_22600 [Neobacillus vireti]|uniref:hypothetical protein n=1 Tax=Neobacillus vireti TaxID=220686 RepID=UPI003000308E